MKAVEFQLKRLLKVSPFTLAFVLFPFASLAVDVKDVPNPRQMNGTWVTDMAQMLDERTEAQLNSTIAQLERKNGTEIAVVTVPETAPAASPKEFTTKLFNYWGIGKKGKDNGVLFLISQNERRVEIETGYGIEPILPDAKVGNIIDTQILPRFKQSDFNGGTLAGTKALVVALEANQPAATSASQTALPTQSSNLSQQVTQDDDFPWLPLVTGWVVVGGGLVLAIAAIDSAQRRQRRSGTKPSVSTSKVSSSHHYSQPHSHVHSRSRHVEVDVDVNIDIDVSDSNHDCNDWSYQLDSGDDSTSSNFGGGSSCGDGAEGSYESNWNSDSSSCSNDESTSSSWNSDSSSCSNYESSSNWSSDSSDSSWSSDSSSCSSYESSSSSSDFGGGSDW
jgi:uncharacterized membrane protein YgcG